MKLTTRQILVTYKENNITMEWHDDAEEDIKTLVAFLQCALTDKKAMEYVVTRLADIAQEDTNDQPS